MRVLYAILILLVSVFSAMQLKRYLDSNAGTHPGTYGHLLSLTYSIQDMADNEACYAQAEEVFEHILQKRPILEMPSPKVALTASGQEMAFNRDIIEIKSPLTSVAPVVGPADEYADSTYFFTILVPPC